MINCALGPIFAVSGSFPEVMSSHLPFQRFSGLLLGSLLALSSIAQSDSARTAPSAPLDTSIVHGWRARHKPGRAALFSAIIPGAGQIYNRKYWKAPIAWAGLGVCVYFIKTNTEQFIRYRDDYVALVDNDPNTVDEFHGQVSASALRSVADTYHKWRDLSYLCIAGVYILNIVDAAVDGYFVRFDVSDDLTLDIRPSLSMAARGALGVSVSLHL